VDARIHQVLGRLGPVGERGEIGADQGPVGVVAPGAVDDIADGGRQRLEDVAVGAAGDGGVEFGRGLRGGLARGGVDDGPLRVAEGVELRRERGERLLIERRGVGRARSPGETHELVEPARAVVALGLGDAVDLEREHPVLALHGAAKAKGVLVGDQADRAERAARELGVDQAAVDHVGEAGARLLAARHRHQRGDEEAVLGGALGDGGLRLEQLDEHRGVAADRVDHERVEAAHDRALRPVVREEE